MEMFDVSTSPPFGHLRTGSSQSHLIMTNCGKLLTFRKARTGVVSDHPSSPIISPAVTRVKHFLSKFFGSGGSGWEG
jgi:hypothetical protein